ncbi:hypothetical protein GCM10027278_27620 [Paralcaligenes ginsengisoli]
MRAGAKRAASSRDVFRLTALTAALLGMAGTACADTLLCGGPGCTLDPALTYTSVVVNNLGIATGNNSRIAGSLYELTKVNAGGGLTLTGAYILNDVSTPTGTNGRGVTASGVGATASLTNSDIVLRAFSSNPGTNYAHAYTAGVGADAGGHVDISGGSITASGSKRTVGMEAKDGGSINASNLAIDTYSSFGHAVNAYRTVTLGDSVTAIDLDHVTINTHDLNYAVGIQSANKGASVNATATDITTVGTNSFGVEVFNGATVVLTNGSIATSGATAAGVRAYGGGVLGLGAVTVNGTRIATSGLGAAGVVAGAEGSAGIVNLNGGSIVTMGGPVGTDGSAGVLAQYGSQVSLVNTSVTTSGANAQGLLAAQGTSSGPTVINAVNTTVATSGAGAGRVRGEWCPDHGERRLHHHHWGGFGRGATEQRQRYCADGHQG